MTVSITPEAFSPEIFAETLPLAQKCWDESTVFKGQTCAYYGHRDFAVQPDVEAYQRLADQGLLIFITLRDEQDLKGYVLGFLYHSLHHMKILCAIGDSIYIDPDYRSYTAVLAAKFEKEAKERGVEIIGWPVHLEGPVYEVLKALKYIGDDIVMEKRLSGSEQRCA